MNEPSHANSAAPKSHVRQKNARDLSPEISRPSTNPRHPRPIGAGGSKLSQSFERRANFIPRRPDRYRDASVSGYKIPFKVRSAAGRKRSNTRAWPPSLSLPASRSFSLENGASRYPASLVKGRGTASCSTGTLSVHSVYLPILGVSTRENVLYTYIQRRLSRLVTEVKPGWCPR